VKFKSLAASVAACTPLVGASNRGASLKRASRTNNFAAFGALRSIFAWTDGKTYIVYDRKCFARYRRSLVGWDRYCRTMCHEYSHWDDGKTHDDRFYERFHDTLDDFLKPLNEVYSGYIRELELKSAGLEIEGRSANETVDF